MPNLSPTSYCIPIRNAYTDLPHIHIYTYISQISLHFHPVLLYRAVIIVFFNKMFYNSLLMVLPSLVLLFLSTTISAQNWQDGDNGKIRWASNCDFFGSDIEKKNGPGERCGNFCLANSRCTHFTSVNNVCYMKRITNSNAVPTNHQTAVCGLVVAAKVYFIFLLMNFPQYDSRFYVHRVVQAVLLINWYGKKTSILLIKGDGSTLSLGGEAEIQSFNTTIVTLKIGTIFWTFEGELKVVVNFLFKKICQHYLVEINQMLSFKKNSAICLCGYQNISPILTS